MSNTSKYGTFTTSRDSTPRILLKRLREVMAAELTPQERLDLLTDAIASNMVSDVCSIYLRREDDVLELFSTVGLNRDAVHETRLQWGEGLVGFIALKGEPLSLSEASKHPAFSYRPEVGEEKLSSFMGVPILRSGHTLGVLVVQNKMPRTYTEEEIEAAQTVATVLAEIAAAGELLGEEDTQEVDRVLHRSEHIIGMSIVGGLVIGTAALHEPPAPKHTVFAKSVGEENARLELALIDLQKSVDDMIAANKELSSVSREVLEVYRLFAYDKGWTNRLQNAVRSGLSAETAVEQVQGENRKRMKMASDPYLRERLADLEDLSRRLLRMLTGAGDEQLILPDNAVLFARSLGPAELLELDKTKLKAVVLGEGAETSHAAIVARSLEIPLVGRASLAVEYAEDGDAVIVDGLQGEVYIRPGEDTLSAYRDKIALYSEAQAEYASLRDLPATTQDGTEIELLMNAGLVIDMHHLEETGAAGVGLFRTELQFLISTKLPTASEQEALYTEVLDEAGDHPVVFRTADLGSDKAANYMQVHSEANPAMGWRGLRMSIDREGLIRPQLRALLGASAGRQLQLLLPLVTTSEEVLQIKAILQKEIERKERRNRPLPTEILIGAMIEIPAAAWRLEDIAPHVDFLSLGGNDLAQFFFAADREAEKLSGRYDPLHPAFLSFLKTIVDKAKAADKPICYCGEQVSDPLMALALLAIDVLRVSVAATSVGPLKKLIRAVDLNDLAAWIEPKLALPVQSLRGELLEYAREKSLPIKFLHGAD